MLIGKLMVLSLFTSDSRVSILNHFLTLPLPGDTSCISSGSGHCLILAAKQEGISVSLQIADVPQRCAYGFPTRVLGVSLYSVAVGCVLLGVGHLLSAWLLQSSGSSVLVPIHSICAVWDNGAMEA